MTKQETYERDRTLAVAGQIVEKLAPHCEKIMVVGSLRRQCETVHDIDIVLCEAPGFTLSQSLILQHYLGGAWQYLKGKSKIVNGIYSGIPVDLYFATPETWWTLVVIRTGSAQHNIKLCQRAKSLGMKLHADGSGIEELHTKVLWAVHSEEEVFKILQLDYVEPKDRK